MDTTTLLDLAIAETEATEGRPHARELAPWQVREKTATRAAYWTQADDAFLRENLGIISEEAIAEALGRTVVAIHLRWCRELGLPAPSKDPAYITAYQAGLALGLDAGHVVQRWVDSGLLPGERIPFNGARLIRRIRRVTFERWVVKPSNWVYFDPGQVADPHLARLLALRQARWGDAWLTANQAAALCGVSHESVKAAMYRGALPFVRVVNRAGREPRGKPRRDMGGGFGWGSLFVLRSDALAQVWYPGAGPGKTTTYNHLQWDPAADAFLILAVAMGNPVAMVDRMLGIVPPAKRTEARIAYLHRSGKLAGMIERFGLPVAYDPETGALFADWRLHVGRFPALAGAIRRYMTGRASWADLLNVRAVLNVWTKWHTPKDNKALRRLRRVGGQRQFPTKLRNAWANLVAQGFEPLKEADDDGLD